MIGIMYYAINGSPFAVINNKSSPYTGLFPWRTTSISININWCHIGLLKCDIKKVNCYL